MLRSLRVFLMVLIVTVACSAFAAADSPSYSGAFTSGLTWTLSGGTLTVSNPGSESVFFGEPRDADAAQSAALQRLMQHADEIEKIVFGPGISVVPESQYSPRLDNFSNLKEVHLPDGSTRIEMYTFMDCVKLEKVIIPDSVQAILPFAFGNCHSLSHLFLNENITSIDQAAFYYCNNLSLDAPEGSSAYNYAVNNGIPISHRYGSWTLLKEATATEAGLREHTCADCGKTEQCVIPKELGEPEGSGILDNGLTWYLEKGTLTVINPGSEPADFFGSEVTDDSGNSLMSAVTKLVLGKGVILISGIGIPQQGDFSKVRTVILPEDMLIIGIHMFNEFPSLETIQLPEGVTLIESFAFASCAKMRTINFPDSLTEIHDGAFAECTNLAALNLSATDITSIGPSAFRGCTGMTDVRFPATLRKIMTEAFLNCSGLSYVTIPASVTTIGDDAFYGCGSDLVFDTPTNSAGYQYALRYNIPVTHKYGQWRTVKAATTAAEGLREHVCVNCGEKEQQSIPKTESAGQAAHDASGSAASSAHSDTSAQAATASKSSTKASSKSKKKESDKAKAKRLAKKLKKPKLKVKRKKGRNKLSWNKVKYASGYELYIKYPGAKKYVKALRKGSSIKSVTHRGLTRGRKYKYKLRAYVKVGKVRKYGPFSKAVSAKVK